MRSRKVRAVVGGALALTLAMAVTVPASGSPIDALTSFATGQLVTEGGAAVAGAYVAAHAREESSGDERRTETVRVADTRTDDDGTFTLELLDLDAISPLVGPDGLIDVTIAAIAPSAEDSDAPDLADQALETFTVEVVDGSLSAARHVTQVVSGVVLGHVELVLGVAGTSSDGSGSSSTPAGPAEEDPQPAVPPVRSPIDPGDPTGINPSGRCAEYRYDETNGRHVAIMPVYNYGTIAYPTFSSGSRMELGAAVSASGAYGEFETSSSLVRKAGSEVKFAAYSGINNFLHYTEFRYGYYDVYFTGPFGCYFSHREFKPWKWHGGARAWQIYGDEPKPPAVNCAFFEQSSAFMTERARSVTWTNGVKVKALIGIDLKSQAGFTQNVILSYQVGSERGAEICGIDDSPTYASRILAKPYWYKEYGY